MEGASSGNGKGVLALLNGGVIGKSSNVVAGRFTLVTLLGVLISLIVIVELEEIVEEPEEELLEEDVLLIASGAVATFFVVVLPLIQSMRDSI